MSKVIQLFPDDPSPPDRSKRNPKPVKYGPATDAARRTQHHYDPRSGNSNGRPTPRKRVTTQLRSST